MFENCENKIGWDMLVKGVATSCCLLLISFSVFESVLPDAKTCFILFRPQTADLICSRFILFIKVSLIFWISNSFLLLVSLFENLQFIWTVLLNQLASGVQGKAWKIDQIIHFETAKLIYVLPHPDQQIELSF